ncbi:MAG: plasmid pRiA4b ORF-3 family protein, partial [Proteobacteria bacterium]|nr:plasmid pRiA4b ORF-3 family protein [Pseudomonadota bacterium]
SVSPNVRCVSAIVRRRLGSVSDNVRRKRASIARRAIYYCAPLQPGIVYPRLIEAVGRCPPEDVGGPWGYSEFREAIADPNHEEHAERLEWVGGTFDPANADAEALAQAVDKLARKWARKPSATRKPT